MTTEQKTIRAKVGLLELAKQLGNVSQACKMMGYSRRRTRIASRGMLLNKFPPMTGVTTPNRVGVVDGITLADANATNWGTKASRPCRPKIPLVHLLRRSII
jgi:hypothetical protein